MKSDANPIGDDSGAVSGQAEAVLQNLFRTQTLPAPLSLSIEEIIERAWELAYRRRNGAIVSNVIALPVKPGKSRSSLKQ